MKQHGYSQSRTYASWECMKQRCDNKNKHNYAKYGGRGISYDERWKDFREFLKDMGECPNGMTLDRKNTDRDYFKDNCKWSTRKEQNNNKLNNKILTHLGMSLTVSQWADKIGIHRRTISSRLRRGWTIESSLVEHVNPRMRRPLISAPTS